MCRKLVESEPRKKLLVQIKEHPGIRHRQLLRLTGLSNGQMSFHLKKLTTSKLVRIKKIWI